MKRPVVFSLLVLLACQNASCGGGGGAGAGAGFDPLMAQRLQQSLEDSLEELAVPGAAVAVRAPDGSTWSGASGDAILPGQYGLNEAKAAIGGTPMTTGTHFRIASVTKSFTATIILQLVDEGKLSLDETLGQIMSRWFAPGYIDFAIPFSDAITLRNILQMRSGMVDYLSNAEGASMMAQDPLQKVDPKEFLRISAQSTDPAPYAPDTRMEYCNTNFILQGIIIEQVTGHSYTEEAVNRLFTPLGLEETSVPDGTEMPSPSAHGYLPDAGLVRDMTASLDPSFSWAAGSIISTVGDVVTWVTALNDGSLLSPAMQEERMTMQDGIIEGWPVSYGLGIYDDSGAVGHYGNFGKFYTAYAMRYGGYDVAVLTNGELAEHSEEGRHPARSIFWNAVRDIGIEDVVEDVSADGR